ncbi:hypothetical protein [Fervidibacillus albus]|uniref:Uncharacterized protein n=1 Tax=Fervidibacillus albus TaxID=2980026 RepID=A0A9E8LT32_9BACI|nr:hypothetical protein [Fervidibacillus albus]WAA08885.1 hypothetical protein OE104_09730 [Fervidibacillus albus]
MYIVYFMENKNVILCQYRKQIPNLHEKIRMKGRMGTITNIQEREGFKIYVEVLFEKRKRRN